MRQLTASDIPIQARVFRRAHVTVRADLSAFPPALRGPDWRDTVSLRIEGGTVETSRHRFDDLWWEAPLSPHGPPTDEGRTPLFPSEVDDPLARGIWARMLQAARPHLDRRALRLARVAGGVQRLYEAIAWDDDLVRLVQYARAAGPLLAFHRAFRLRADESLDTAFSRLLREANPVARSYIPSIAEVEVPDPLPAFFLAWARRVRLTPRFRPCNAAQLWTTVNLIYGMCLESVEQDPAALDRLRTVKAWVLLHEAVVRGSGLAEVILREPQDAVRAVSEHRRDLDAPWATRAADYLGHIEAPTWGGRISVPAGLTLSEWAARVEGEAGGPGGD